MASWLNWEIMTIWIISIQNFGLINNCLLTIASKTRLSRCTMSLPCIVAKRLHQVHPAPAFIFTFLSVIRLNAGIMVIESYHFQTKYSDEALRVELKTGDKKALLLNGISTSRKRLSLFSFSTKCKQRLAVSTSLTRASTNVAELAFHSSFLTD